MRKRILVSPLDWGLGHATRCVPLISKLVECGHHVILGVTPLTEKILRPAFPALELVAVPSANIRYSKFLPVWASVIIDFPRLLGVMKEEERRVDELVRKHGIDVVISDNRYGFHSTAASRNIFITHQVKVMSPVMEGAVNRKLQDLYENFHEVWVPDSPDKDRNLSGDLSHIFSCPVPVKFVGALSRMQRISGSTQKKYRAAFILSGAEPKRTQFESEIISDLDGREGKYIIVRGCDRPLKTEVQGNVELIDLADHIVIQRILADSEKVIARSGYSTIMDLAVAHVPSIIIATPGQTEQEYLARHLDKKYCFRAARNAAEAISMHAYNSDPYPFGSQADLLSNAVNSL